MLPLWDLGSVEEKANDLGQQLFCGDEATKSRTPQRKSRALHSDLIDIPQSERNMHCKGIVSFNYISRKVQFKLPALNHNTTEFR